jgi:hypothetical protein
MFDTPILKYRPTRVADHFGSTLVFGTPVKIWGDVERSADSRIEVDINADEDVAIGDILVFQT